MKTAIAILTIFSFPMIVSGQDMYGHQWVLNRFVLLDFRSDTLQLSVLEDTIEYGSGDYCTSISNEEGELMFYSGGCYIINAENKIMENGDSINTDYAYSDFCFDGDFPVRESNTALPYPENDQMYIFFHLDIHIVEEIVPAILNLNYHIIDMNQSGGLGAIVDKNQVALSDTLARGYIQATRQGNGNDWWLTVPEWNSNCYYIIPVTSTGVGSPEKQCIGGVWHNLDGGGQAVFSPNGKKYARIGGQVGLFLFDFNNAQGSLSNPLELTYPYKEEYFRGVAFSPNSRFLYVAAQLDLFQFDLEADNIQGSIQLVGQLNPDDAFPGAGSLSLEKLAPDGRIYISSPGSHKYLSIINRPNCPGISCDFQPWAIELPLSNYSGLPNLPQFNNHETNNNCDSLVAAHEVRKQQPYRVFPNPTSQKIYIQSQFKTSTYIILDPLGNKITTGFLQNGINEIDISFLHSGIYYISSQDLKSRTLGIKKILVVK